MPEPLTFEEKNTLRILGRGPHTPLFSPGIGAERCDKMVALGLAVVIEEKENGQRTYELAPDVWTAPVLRNIQRHPAWRGDWDTEGWPEWKALLTNEAGEWDELAIKNEFHDYAVMLHEVPQVYCHITKYRFSYPTYKADDVISWADEATSKDFREWHKEKAAPLVEALKMALADYGNITYPTETHKAVMKALRDAIAKGEQP